MFLYSKFTCGSYVLEEKNGLEIRFLVPEIFNKYKRSIFLGHPVNGRYMDKIDTLRCIR